MKLGQETKQSKLNVKRSKKLDIDLMTANYNVIWNSFYANFHQTRVSIHWIYSWGYEVTWR